MIYVTELRKCYDIANRKDFDYSMCHGTQTQLQMSNNIKKLCQNKYYLTFRKTNCFTVQKTESIFVPYSRSLKIFMGAKQYYFNRLNL